MPLHPQQFHKQLEDRLLAIGGNRVVGHDDDDLSSILEHGELAVPSKGDDDVDGIPVEFVNGRPGQCHSNVAGLCDSDEWVTPRTGFALSEDGIWRPHSWAHDVGEGSLIETTEPRTHYFGFEPDRDSFIDNNR